ncbi:MAG: hypothetical protein QOI98_3476 [Solirubrobacteraceae bacterium]|jgi:hypothetical protein|nr:hypothetical protein [Solirubrobacteraceae bacterium]
MLNAGVDVISSDGERIGKIEHVRADPEIDVFDGLVIEIHLGPGGQRFAEADEVDESYERGRFRALRACPSALVSSPRRSAQNVRGWPQRLPPVRRAATPASIGGIDLIGTIRRQA